MVGQAGVVQNHSPAFSNRKLATFSKASRPENGKPLSPASKTAPGKVVSSLSGANGPSPWRMDDE